MDHPDVKVVSSAGQKLLHGRFRLADGWILNESQITKWAVPPLAAINSARRELGLWKEYAEGPFFGIPEQQNPEGASAYWMQQSVEDEVAKKYSID